MITLVEYRIKCLYCIRLLIFSLSWSFGLHLDQNWKVLIFGNVAKTTLSVTICEQVVPRLNNHDDVIEWNFMKIPTPKWRAGCALGFTWRVLLVCVGFFIRGKRVATWSTPKRSHGGAKRAMPPPTFLEYSHFVLWEAVSQAKNCFWPKIKHFDQPKFLCWLRCWSTRCALTSLCHHTHVLGVCFFWAQMRKIRCATYRTVGHFLCQIFNHDTSGWFACKNR